MQGGRTNLGSGKSLVRMFGAEEEIETEVLEKYTLRQFLMDVSLRFYSSNVASIEIN